MESERRRDFDGETAASISEQAHRRIDALLDRIAVVQSAADANADSYVERIDELMRQLDSARRRAIEEALTEVGNALDGWVEGARSNCEASDHHHGGDEPCGDVFAVEDIRAMVADARRQLAMPIVAVEDGGVVPVASVHETPASVEALKRDLRRALAEHDEARAQCSRLNRELDDARDERDRWKNAYENAAETKRAAISSLIAERDAWKQQANDDAERFVRAAERAGSEQRRVDEIAAELETALRQRDAAHGVIANLRAVLANVVGTLDDLDPNAGQENKS